MNCRLIFIGFCLTTAHALSAQFSGIGVVSPTHTLHVRPLGTAEPIRFEGLTAGTAADTHVLAVDPATGILRTVARSTLGDNLGSHIATENIQLDDNWLSNDGDSEGIRINDAGNVGVAQAAGLLNFEVEGSAHFGTDKSFVSGAYQLQSNFQNNSSKNNLGFIQTPWVYANAIEAPNEKGNVSTAIIIGYENNYNSATDNIALVTTGLSRLQVTPNGFIGIGTTTPVSLLEVDGRTTTQNFTMTNGANNGYILQTNATGVASWVDPATVPGVGDNLGNHIATENIQLGSFYLSSDGDNEGVAIRDNGFVGIGNNNPTNLLDIQTGPRSGAHSTNRPLYTTSNNSQAGNGVEFMHHNGTQGIGFGYNSIYAAGTNTNQNLNLIPKGTGRVGVGTLTPADLLHVAGRTRTEDFTMTTGATNGYILQSNATGIATWVDPSTISAAGDNLGNHIATTNLDMSTHDANFTTGEINFDSNRRQMLNLWGTTYGIGIQSNVLYNRTASDFVWYRGGAHDNATFNAGGGTLQMALLDNGNLGIGTVDAMSKLTIGNNILHDSGYDYSEAQFTVFDPNPNGGNSPNGTRDILNLVREGISGQAFGNKAAFALGRFENSSTSARSQLDIKLTDASYTVHNTIMSLRSNGNVGIGTTAPTALLDVNGAARIRTMPAAANSDDIVTVDATGNLRRRAASSLGGDDLGNHTATQNIRVGNNWLSGDGGNEGISIGTEGHIGVNTGPRADARISAIGANDVPGLYLTGEDNIWFDGGQVRITTHDGTGNWQIKGGADNDDNKIGSNSGATKLRIDESGSFVIQTASGLSSGDAISWNNNFYASEDGNVGINTLNPTVQFDVVGDVRIRTLPAGVSSDQIVTADGAGNLRKVTQSSLGDNLGNHTATQNINIGTNWINSSIANRGFSINNNSQAVIVGSGSTSRTQGTLNLESNNANPAKLVIQGGGGNDYFSFFMTNDANDNGEAYIVTSDNFDEPLHFGRHGGGANPLREDMTLRQGRLGIGTTTPNANLHIAVGPGEDAVLRLQSDDANSASGEEDNPQIIFTQDGVIDVSAIGHGLITSLANPNVLQIANAVNGGAMQFLTGSGTAGYSASASRLYITAAGNVGIGTDNPSQRLHVIGNILASGTVTTSDSTLKANIVPLTYGLQELLKMQPVAYDWKANLQQDQGYDSAHQVGFIAQHMQSIIPEAVIGEEGNGMGIDYGKVMPVVVAAVQEQNAQVVALENTVSVQGQRIAILEAELAGIKALLQNSSK